MFDIDYSEETNTRNSTNPSSRGGRMTKWKGKAASLSPNRAVLLCSVCSISLTSFTPTITFADCSGESGSYVCSGTTTSTQSLIGFGTGLAVATEDGFNVTTISGNGVELVTDSIGPTLSFTDNNFSDITADQRGIYAVHSGLGAANITSTGVISSQSSQAVYVRNYGDSLTLSVNEVSGNKTGISAHNERQGALIITATGTVTGTSERGIEARNYGTSLTIVAADVDARNGLDGIYARSRGNDAISITSTGTVRGGQRGINVDNYFGTSVTIETIDVEGGETGIQAKNRGSGALSIASIGSISGLSANGITAENDTEGTDLNLYVNAVSGQVDGINAINEGTGKITISASDTITGTDGVGIYANNLENGTHLEIAVADVQGANNGINALNSGAGNLYITSTGLIENTATPGADTDSYNTSAAIWAKKTNTGNMYVNVVDVKGTLDGIYASNTTTGDQLNITTTGSVIGTAQNGIYALNDGSSMNIRTVDVTGGQNGIKANHTGTDGITITSTGTIIGNADDGIDVLNYGKDLTIDVQNVTGAQSGISARSDRFSDTTITATGSIIGGSRHAGIDASSYYGKTMDITVSDVTGGKQGIVTHTEGVETLNITINGTVKGQDLAAVELYATGGTNISVTLNEGAVVNSDNGQAIIERENNSEVQDQPDTTVTLNSGSTVSGQIKLGNGSDQIVFAGGDFSGVTLFDGGDDSSAADGDIDKITLVSEFDGSTLGLDRFRNWELIEVDSIALSGVSGETTIGDQGAGTGLSLINSGSVATASGFTLNGRMTIGEGSVFNASAGGNTINGPVSNSGTISLADNEAGDILTIAGNLEGSGTLSFDTTLGEDTSVTDTLIVQGDFNADALIVVNNIDGLGANTVEGIELVSVAGSFNGSATLQGDFTTNSGDQALIIGAYAYTLEQGADGSLRLQGSDGGDVGTVRYQPSVPVYELYPNVLHSLNRLPSHKERMGAQRQNAENKKLHATLDPFWLRMTGSHDRLRTDDSNTDVDGTVDHVMIEAGAQIQALQAENGVFHSGLVLTYGQAWGTTKSRFGNGDIDTEAFGVGLTGTWQSDSGFYIDAQARYTWFWSDLKSDDIGKLKDSDNGYGLAASLEFGKPMTLQSGLIWTPQIQFYYSGVYFDSFTDQNGVLVTKRDGDEWAVRAGLTAESQTSANSKIYGLANVFYKINSSSEVGVADSDVGNSSKNLSVEFGLGGDMEFAKNARLYGEVAGRSSFEKDFSVRGTFGMKWTF